MCVIVGRVRCGFCGTRCIWKSHTSQPYLHKQLDITRAILDLLLSNYYLVCLGSNASMNLFPSQTAVVRNDNRTAPSSFL